jgi:hypothetical protein
MVPTGSTGNTDPGLPELPPPPQESSGSGGGAPEFLALALLAALGLAALRLRFSGVQAIGRDGARGSPEGSLLPPRPSLLFRPTHHERMHDEKYLKRMLEAEREAAAQPPSVGEADKTLPPQR